METASYPAAVCGPDRSVRLSGLVLAQIQDFRSYYTTLNCRCFDDVHGPTLDHYLAKTNAILADRCVTIATSNSDGCFGTRRTDPDRFAYGVSTKPSKEIRNSSLTVASGFSTNV